MESLWFVRFDRRLPRGSRLVDPARTERESELFLRSLLCELILHEPAIALTRELDCSGHVFV
jgi:hypothetical protein